VNPRARAGFVLGLVLVVGSLGASYLLERRSDPVDPHRPPPVADAPRDISFDEQKKRIRVEVLNGAGDAGAAARITEVLSAAGVDVKTYGNAARYDYERSVVLDRSGRPGAARAVAEILNGAEVEEQLDTELYLDATVILGDDWRTLMSAPAIKDSPR